MNGSVANHECPFYQNRQTKPGIITSGTKVRRAPAAVILFTGRTQHSVMEKKYGNRTAQ